HNDRRAGGPRRQVAPEPVELLVAQDAETLVVALAGDIDHADKMDPSMVEAVPALTLGAFAEPVEIFRIADQIVFARHVEDLPCPDTLQDLGDSVKFPVRREMSEVAGMDDEVRLLRKRVDLAHCLLERGRNAFLVWVFAEPDMAVADLDE